MIRKIAVIGFCSLLVAGCGRDEADTATPAGADSGAGQADATAALFDRVDADTAWIGANLEPVPEELSDKLWAPLQSMADFNRSTYSGLADELEDEPLAAAFLRELAAIDSKEAFAERGLDPNGRWAVHAVSIYPFIHWQLTDPEAFRATIERIAANAGTSPNWREIDDAEVLWANMGRFGVALHHDDRFLTLAIVPDNLALLRRVANLDQPETAFDPADLRRFSNERGYTPYGSGYLESGRLVDLLLDEDDEMLAAVRETGPLKDLASDAACRSELDALVERFPRTSFGYTRLDSEGSTMDATVETDPDFASRLMVLADTPVALDGRARSGLFSFGLAFNLVGARDLAREIVAGWVDNPPQCSAFASIRENAESWQLALNQPIPPMVTNFHGLRLSVDSLLLGEQGNPESAEATLALFMRNPEMMLGMAQMFSPEMAALDIQPGGEPQPLPGGVIPNLPPGISAFVGMGQTALGLAVGESQRDALNEAMNPGEGGNAIMSWGMDIAGYADTMSSLIDGIGAQLEAATGSNDMQDSADALKAMGEFYDYTEASLHLTERGIEFRSSAVFKK